MKTLILWVVMLAVVCLCAISANADMLLDSFNYPNTAALDAVWSGSPTMATFGIGNVPCMDLYMDGTGAGNALRYVRTTGSWNLTGCTGATFSMAGTNPSQVLYTNVVFWMNGFTSNWTVYTWTGPTSQWQTISCSEAGGFGSATAADWANVNAIDVGYYTNANSTPGDVYFSNLIANGVTATVQTPVISPNGPNYAAIVSITCSTPGATIMYTTDGSTPTLTNGTAFTSSSAPFLINQVCTVKAAGFLTGYVQSAMAQASFTTHNNLLIDSFNYPSTTALQAVWYVNAGWFSSVKATMATIDGVPCMDAYMPSTTGVSGYSGVEFLCNALTPLDLTGCTALTYSLAATDPAQVYYPWTILWMDSTSTYLVKLQAVGNQWQQGSSVNNFTGAGWWGLTGTSDLSNVTGLAFGCYLNPNTGPGDVYIANLIADGVVQTAAPVFSPNGGAYPATVTITCATSGATIVYTTDGTTPTKTNGSVISSGATIPVNHDMILKAAAWATGYAGSPVTEATYEQPQGNIPYTSSVTMDADFTKSPWSSATWIPITQVFASSATPPVWPDDVTTAQWTAYWGNGGNTVYVGVKVLDTAFVFNDAYNGENNDHVELFIHTTGTGPAAYDAFDDSAQQYCIGVTNDETQTWKSMVAGAAVPASAGFQAAAVAVDSTGWIYYEAAITPFQFFGGLESVPNVVSTLYPGETVGLDVLVVSRNYNGDWAYLSENMLAPKYNDYDAIGLHQLTYGTISIGQAKNSTANSTVGISGIVSAVFPNCFYVESSDRTFGIRVNMSGNNQVVGTIVDLSGPIQVMSTGEAAITTSSVLTAPGSGSIKPLALTNKAVGGSAFGLQSAIYGATGLNNVGLLVKTTGKVTGKDTSGSPAWFTIDDGSGVSLKVYGTVPSGIPYVTVTGASSCEKDTNSNVQRVILATGVQIVQ